jgi:uncharacterized membrane protein YkgB
MYSGARIEDIGTGMTRYGLASFIGGMGALKFTDYEANNIKPLLENSPLTSWLFRRIGMRGTVRVVGVAELAIASLLAFPPRRSRLSALGSVLSLGMFGVTLSFLFSTPAARTRSTKGVPILTAVGQDLAKDLVLLGASVLTLGESLRRHESAGAM